MKLVPDWKRVARRAWSVRLAVAAAVFSSAEVVLPRFDGLLPPKLFAILSFVVVLGSAVARLVAQPRMHE